MGSTADLFCNHCGAACPSHARFCPVCGQAISTQESEVLKNSAVPPVAPSASALARARAAEHPPEAPCQLSPSTPPPVVNPAPPIASTPLIQQPPLKGQYRLLRKIGSGGYGIVYKATDKKFGNRLVAIKEMSQKGLSPQEIEEASEAFKHEAFLLAGLTHPGLPSIYDYFDEDDRWYLVMSFIEGETLEAYLNRASHRRLPAEKVLQIGNQLAAVLSYLHERRPPVVFRDLKPTNIMRTYDGQIYLIDFGIARHFKQGQLKDTMALGSPGYAAPEQYGRVQTTPQADVYSLGVTMHQMLSSLDPSQSPFNLPRLNIPEYPQLSILIACMLEMDPKKRPASMGNIKRELHRIATGRSHGSSSRSNAKKRPANRPAYWQAGVPMPSQPVQIFSIPPQSVPSVSSSSAYPREWYDPYNQD